MYKKRKVPEYKWSVQIDEESKKLILNNYCEVFSQFFHLTDSDIGKPIEEVLDCRTSFEVYKIFENFIRNKDVMTYAREFDGGIWKIEASYVAPLITFYGTILSSVQEINQVIKFDNNYGIGFFDGEICSSLLKEKEGGYIIVDASEGFYKKMGIKENENYSCVFENLLYLRSPLIMSMALANKSAVAFLDILTSPVDGTREHISIVGIPICNEEKYVHVLYKKIDEAVYYESQISNRTFGEDFNKYSVAVASYEIAYGGELEICFSNQYFKKTIKTDEDKDMVYNNLLKKISTRKSVRKSNFYVSGTEYCGLSIPIESQNKIFVLLFEVKNKSQTPDYIFAILTKRENEVMNLLVHGYTIKYISYDLKIADGTVKKIISNIYKKLGVNSRVDLMIQVLNL
ncbi:hypothetical protein AGMMS50284_0220 [Clostridia bacterium]|nr:hypothetical protein AGMMS50284_0220 [Clostridia bacterium]